MALLNAEEVVIPTPLDVQVANKSTFTVRTETVVTAGVPVNAAALPVPNDVAVVIQNDPANANADVVYLANSGANTALPASRLELKRSQSVALHVSNLNLLWFDASSNGVAIKLIVEG